jgi:DNA repair protein RadC
VTGLRDLPPDARPREKLLARGPSALADAELLALLLRTGTAGQGVLQMAQALLDRFGGLAGLLAARADELAAINGVGPAKRTTCRCSWPRSTTRCSVCCSWTPSIG